MAASIMDADDMGGPLRTLKIVQTAGAEKTVYGSLLAKRTMDKWDTTAPEFNSGLSELGQPRGAFLADTVVEGSDAYRQKLKERKDRHAEVVRKKDEGKRKIEEERLAKVAAEKAIIDARRQQLLDISAVGKKYVGTVDGRRDKGRVELVFTKQSGFLIEAEISNSEDPSQKRLFTGEIVFDTEKIKIPQVVLCLAKNRNKRETKMR